VVGFELTSFFGGFKEEIFEKNTFLFWIFNGKKISGNELQSLVSLLKKETFGGAQDFFSRTSVSVFENEQVLSQSSFDSRLLKAKEVREMLRLKLPLKVYGVKKYENAKIVNIRFMAVYKKS
jgi:hypothetical protein